MKTFLHVCQWKRHESDSTINVWYSTWRRREDARDPLEKFWVTVGQNDVAMGAYVTTQYHSLLTHRKQQEFGDQSMGVFIDFSVF